MKNAEHKNGKGITRDTRKARLATINDWAHFQIVPEDITVEVIAELINFTRERMK